MRAARRLKAAVYDAIIVSMTARWYAAVLEQLPYGCRLLDVGIGTGAAWLANAGLVRAKELRIVGIDIDRAYVECCREAVTAHGLSDRIDAKLESVYDHAGGPYDAAYFSGSFMLLPDPAGALRHVSRLLAPGASVFFTQTFEHERSPLLERLKPALRLLTSIDFGAVTYEHDFVASVRAAGHDVVRKTPIQAGRARSSFLVVVRRGGDDAFAAAPGPSPERR